MHYFTFYQIYKEYCGPVFMLALVGKIDRDVSAKTPFFSITLLHIRERRIFTLVIKNSVRSTRLESDESIFPIFDEDGEVVLEAVEDLDEEKDDKHRRIMV